MHYQFICWLFCHLIVWSIKHQKIVKIIHHNFLKIQFTATQESGTIHFFIFSLKIYLNNLVIIKIVADSFLALTSYILLFSAKVTKVMVISHERFLFILHSPIRIKKHLTYDLITIVGLFGHCQSNLIKPHPHSPDEAY